MKRIIGLSLLLVSIAAGCKRETNVVEYPAVDFYTTETLDVNRIELTDSTPCCISAPCIFLSSGFVWTKGRTSLLMVGNFRASASTRPHSRTTCSRS